MQGKRTRALDSRGRPVPGLYVRDGVFIAGYQVNGKWLMKNLDAATLTEARRERDSLITGLHEGRVAAPSEVTFMEVFVEYQDARTLSERTRAHERHLVDRHLGALKDRKAQEITSLDVSNVIKSMRTNYSAWTITAVVRILRGSFALALRRAIVTRNPMEGIAPSELPKQRNAKKIAVLDADAIARLVEAGSSERVRAALGLAAYAGLRLGEVRALTWAGVDLEAGMVNVTASALPDGTVKATKTEAGERSVPILPALRRLLVEWKLRTPLTAPSDLVVATASGSPMQERNLRRALDAAKTKANLDGIDERLSWHSLRHSFASLLATDLELPATTLARLTGHTDAGFTLRIYARDGRDTATVVEDVLTRAAAANIGG